MFRFHSNRILLMLGLVTICLLIVIARSGWLMTARNAPLVDASMEIKYELALFHLWFEELMDEDVSLDKGRVWHHLLEARWFAHAMLEGGENQEGRFFPLEKPILRQHIQEALEAMARLEISAHKRLAVGTAGQAGSQMDETFDRLFGEALLQADEVETRIQQDIAAQLNNFLLVSAIIGVMALGLLLLANGMLHRFEITRLANVEALEESEARFRVASQMAETANRALERINNRLLFERETIEAIILRMRGADLIDDRHLRYLISSVEKATGDILLATWTPTGRQMVLVGDFTGHGLPSAIGGPLITYIFKELAGRDTPGATILQTINVQLCARLPGNLFFAATLIDIPPERTHMDLWNASLPKGLLVRSGKIHTRFPSTILPLGIEEEAGIHMAESCQRVALHPGDRLFVFSDGIIEARNRHGEMFGMKRLASFVTQAASRGEALDALLSQPEGDALLGRCLLRTPHTQLTRKRGWQRIHRLEGVEIFLGQFPHFPFIVRPWRYVVHTVLPPVRWPCEKRSLECRQIFQRNRAHEGDRQDNPWQYDPIGFFGTKCRARPLLHHR